MSDLVATADTKRRVKPRGSSLRSAPPSSASQTASIVSQALIAMPHQGRQQLIAEAAYHRAEARGFAPGHELEDWLASEAEVDARLYGERVA